MNPQPNWLSLPQALPPGWKKAARSKSRAGLNKPGGDNSKSNMAGDKPKRSKGGYNDASLLSKVFYCWLDPLLWLGFRRKKLQQEDLFDTPNYVISARLQEKFERLWQRELERKAKGGKPRLWIPVLHLMWTRFLWQFCAASVVIMLTVLQSIILGNLSDYFASSKTPESTRNAFLMALVITLSGFLAAFCRTWELEWALETMVRIRVAVTGLLLKHSINLHLQTVASVSIGKIMSLLSTDVHRFDQSFLFLHYIILAPLHALVVMLLLWFYVGLGPACLPGLILLLLQLPVQYALSNIFMYLRIKAAQYTDDRIKVTKQFLSGIRVIKMYGWEYAFSKLVAATRKMEAIMIALANLFRSVNRAYFSFSNVLINLLIFPTYTLTTGNPITSKMVFTTLSLIAFSRVAAFFFIVEAVLGVREIKVALRRMQDLLMRDWSDKLRKSELYSHTPVLLPELVVSQYPGNSSDGYHPPTRVLSKGTPAHVKVNNLSASWRGGNEAQATLQNVSFECNAASRMLAIVGPVGAGKSSILYCLMGELEPLSGEVAIVGSLGYAAQESWLYTGSVRENILFGQKYEEEWYEKVLDACCLKEDMEQLAVGDMTLVGERGVSLSGGQKARVTLARAVYRKADIYLLDDPLSAVDTAVGRLLFENCLCGLLKDSLVILVTHQLQYAKKADNLLVMSQGQCIAYGSFDELMRKSEEDSTVNITLSEMMADLTSDKEEKPTSNEKDIHEEAKRKSGVQAGYSTKESETFNNVLPEEDKHEGSISFLAYLRYFREGAWYVFLCLMVVLFLVTQASLVTSDWYMSQWATTHQLCALPNGTGLLCNLTVNTIAEIFAGLAGSAIVLSVMRAVLFYSLCVNAARNLHNKMFAALLRAPVRFFDTNPIGRILTRFSKDLFFLDIQMPLQFFDLLDQLLQVLAVLVVTVVANVYMLIAGGAIIVVLCGLQYYFVPQLVKLRRLEAATRSPVYSHITDSLHGLSTIRVCRRKEATMDHYHNAMDENTKGWIFSFNSNRWFALRCDLIGAVFVGVVAFTSIPMSGVLNPGLASLSLVYALSMTQSFRQYVRNSADVQGMMVSVERVVDYSKLEPEAPLETPPGRERPPEAWPQSGTIRVQHMNFRYAEDAPCILKDISIDIKSGEKVGVVGRTGAGKSSLMQALFRMAEPEGSIQIDGVNILDVGLHTLRKKLSIIPQDPVIFSGSVRYNLDPFGEYSDEDIWGALEQVQLKKAVVDMLGGLDASLTEGGSNFSVGQRQMLCLARALLKKNKILIIDEATANVDRVTDAIIQQTIRRELADSTTLTIAHRLNTIMDSDRIMVLSAGRIIEFDTPHTLLQNKDSMFSHLVEQVTPGGTGTPETE